MNDLYLRIAKIAHAVNCAYCRAIGETFIPWDETTEEMRASTAKGVEAVDENPDITPEELHQKWVETKNADGWTYAPIKDVVAKVHPNMAPYYQLPEAQRTKDVIFFAVVKACLDDAMEVTLEEGTA